MRCKRWDVPGRGGRRSAEGNSPAPSFSPSRGKLNALWTPISLARASLRMSAAASVRFCSPVGASTMCLWAEGGSYEASAPEDEVRGGRDAPRASSLLFRLIVAA